jgi:hypothetical protein
MVGRNGRIGFGAEIDLGVDAEPLPGGDASGGERERFHRRPRRSASESPAPRRWRPVVRLR